MSTLPKKLLPKMVSKKKPKHKRSSSSTDLPGEQNTLRKTYSSTQIDLLISSDNLSDLGDNIDSPTTDTNSPRENETSKIEPQELNPHPQSQLQSQSQPQLQHQTIKPLQTQTPFERSNSLPPMNPTPPQKSPLSRTPTEPMFPQNFNNNFNSSNNNNTKPPRPIQKNSSSDSLNTKKIEKGFLDTIKGMKQNISKTLNELDISNGFFFLFLKKILL